MSYGDDFRLCTCGVMDQNLTMQDHSCDCETHIFVEYLNSMVELSKDITSDNKIRFLWEKPNNNN